MLSYVAAPIVGGVIGYVTNYLAIKMMLHPYEAHYVGKWRVPFTPGVVPKEKPRIAKAIGSAVATHLMNEEVLQQNLLSDEMLSKIGEAIDAFLGEQSAEERTLRAFLGQYFKEEEIGDMVGEMTGEVSKTLGDRLRQVGLGRRIAEMAVRSAFGKMGGGALCALGIDKMLQAVAAPLEDMLSNHIDEFTASNAQGLIDEMIGAEKERLLSSRMSDLLSDTEHVGMLRRLALSLYTSFVGNHLPQVLKTLDISSIIEKRINEMEMREAEAVIMSVLSNEMQALCLLGAALGAMIGCINLLF